MRGILGSRTLVVLAGAVLVGMVAVGVGRYLGESSAREAQQRLFLLWPELMAMPQEDRALLALLAVECRLTVQPEGRASTVACLRSVTGADRLKQVTADPANHLERLLQRSLPNVETGDRG